MNHTNPNTINARKPVRSYIAGTVIALSGLLATQADAATVNFGKSFVGTFASNTNGGSFNWGSVSVVNGVIDPGLPANYSFSLDPENAVKTFEDSNTATYNINGTLEMIFKLSDGTQTSSFYLNNPVLTIGNADSSSGGSDFLSIKSGFKDGVAGEVDFTAVFGNSDAFANTSASNLALVAGATDYSLSATRDGNSLFLDPVPTTTAIPLPSSARMGLGIGCLIVALRTGRRISRGEPWGFGRQS
jgi:hypothetical protein